MKQILSALTTLVLDCIETVTIALSVWLLCYLFIATPTQIQGSSMEPNFSTEDRLIAEKISYKFSDPKRGDVVSIHAPDTAHCTKGTGCVFFKRIIGLPNETVEVKNGFFYIDGKKLEESYLPSSTVTHPGIVTKDKKVVLKKDEYFVAGDNREHSSDSRYWGPIKRSDIIAHALLRWFPAKEWGMIPSASYPSAQ